MACVTTDIIRQQLAHEQHFRLACHAATLRLTPSPLHQRTAIVASTGALPWMLSSKGTRLDGCTNNNTMREVETSYTVFDTWRVKNYSGKLRDQHHAYLYISS